MMDIDAAATHEAAWSTTLARHSRLGGFPATAPLPLVGNPALALSLAPMLGRWAMSVGIVAFPYARAQGLGRDMKDQARRPQLALATLLAWVAALLAGAWGLLAFVLAAAVTWGGARFVLRRIPGMTGDTYGALCELVEAVTLLVFCVGA